MALIKCPECGKEISDQEEVCMGCGRPFPKVPKTKVVDLNKRKKKKIILIVAILTVVIVIVGIATYFGLKKKAREDLNGVYNRDDYNMYLSDDKIRIEFSSEIGDIELYNGNIVSLEKIASSIYRLKGVDKTGYEDDISIQFDIYKDKAGIYYKGEYFEGDTSKIGKEECKFTYTVDSDRWELVMSDGKAKLSSDNEEFTEITEITEKEYVYEIKNDELILTEKDSNSTSEYAILDNGIFSKNLKKQ